MPKVSKRALRGSVRAAILDLFASILETFGTHFAAVGCEENVNQKTQIFRGRGVRRVALDTLIRLALTYGT